MRIPFAVALRDHDARTCGAFAFGRGIIRLVDDLDMEIQAAAKERAKAEAALKRADDKLRAALVRGRAAGKGPSHMAKLTGFTREWVARIAPDPKRS